MERVYFIIGCTASGKGAVGRALAKRIGGQIVSVDSMKIYRRMDIGTAKPPPEVRAEIPHHCIDIAEPSERFSVARYIEHADKAIGAIRAAGAVPLAVGGTSLYLKALTEGLFEVKGGAADPKVRAGLAARADAEGLAVLHKELAAADPAAAARIHPNDRKRIIRALEVYALTGRPISQLQAQWEGWAVTGGGNDSRSAGGEDRRTGGGEEDPSVCAGSLLPSSSPPFLPSSSHRRYDCVIIGLRREKADLSRRINLRVRKMAAAGLRDEVARLLAEPAGIAPQAAQAVGYAEMIDHIRGRCGYDEALERIKVNTRRLAKKQRTWQRRFRDVIWIDVSGEEFVDEAVDQILAKAELR
ncbi:MAG: tRNA (adenosine(37)-N6)-dimethylallyltransferase MiaA [Phycisphaerae bacterium]